MKKLMLTVGVLLSLMKVGYSQTSTEPASGYQKRKLKVEEINLVSSYYQQSGNNSAVTGGIGSEKLTDFANSFDLRLSTTDRHNRLHTINLDFNIDHYTSASSDQIDPLTVSSASRSDTHIYPSISWSVRDDVTRTTKGISYAYSTEYDYKSHGITFTFAKASRDNNREVTLRTGAFFDTWTAILPAELRPEGYGSAAHGDRDPVDYKPRNSYNAALSFSQVVNKRMQLLFIVEPSYQQGLLSTPFHRIYFTNGNETVERLPGSRMKLPMGARLSYFVGDNLILRGFYRYYLDDWGMQAHTLNLEASYKFTPFMSLSPFYRFHQQTAVRYFKAYGQHVYGEKYYTSDYDISGLNSHFIGTGIRMAPPGGILGIRPLNSLELRYGHYIRNSGSGMTSNIITLLAKIK